MPKYQITLSIGGTITLEIDASSEDAALNIALEMDPYEAIEGDPALVDHCLYFAGEDDTDDED